MAVVTAAGAGTLESRLAEVRRRVAGAGGDPERVRVVAVTKGFGLDTVAAAAGAGLADVGENYAQELLAKTSGAPAGVRWHFLGPIQRNKVGRLAPLVHEWHGVDRAVAADAVARSAPGAAVYVEVNITGDVGRPGCPAAELDGLVSHCRALPLDVRGLMAIGPAGDPDGSRECFRWLAGQARRLGLDELSMGMSDDFELAVAEGATTLRLGRVLFGPRPVAAKVQR